MYPFIRVPPARAGTRRDGEPATDWLAGEIGMNSVHEPSGECPAPRDADCEAAAVDWLPV